jgi:hypothetical protein
MTWTEVGTTTTAFHASYRYELVNGKWRIVRYACEDGGVATRYNMTSELPDWDAGSPPAWTAMCSTTVDTSGACPAGAEVTDPSTQPVESLKMTLTLLDGTLYTIDAAAKNPDEDLRDDPEAVTNFPPTAGNTDHSIAVIAGDTVVLDLASTHAISDPEGDFLTSARDSYEPLPAGVTVTAADPLELTIVTDSSLSAGVLSDPISLIVSDAFGGAVEITVTVEILEPPNDPPVAALGADQNLLIGQGETVILPLDLSHGVFDPNGDTMTLEVRDWPAPLATKPSVGAPLGELQVSMAAKPSAALGSVLDPVEIRVFDDEGDHIDVFVHLEIVSPTVNTPPTTSATDAPLDLLAGDTATVSVDATHGATDPDGDPIWVDVDPIGIVPTGLTVTTSGLDVTVAADPTMLDGFAGPIPLILSDSNGATVPITVSVTILPPVPEVSDCVLGTLSLSDSTVSRSGGGGGPRVLSEDVFVTLDFTGSCDGLVLKYDTGHPTGLGSGVGRVFPAGAPTQVVLVGVDNGGTEKWTAGTHVLTASTTSDIAVNSVTVTLTVS